MSSEVVLLKMPSHNRKKRAKQRAKYLQKRGSNNKSSEENKARAQARYEAIQKRRPPYAKGDIESKRSAKRKLYQRDLEVNRAGKRKLYQRDLEVNRAGKRNISVGPRGEPCW